MVGRSPEYLGKKIEAREIQLAMLAIIAPNFIILAFSAVAISLPVGLAGLSNQGAARPFRDPLRIHFGRGQQRLRLRRPLGQHALL
jgi:hypothetical protein